MRFDDVIDLSYVHPVLSATVLLAASRYRVFRPSHILRVTSGLRTEAAQAALVKKGASRTMASKHLEGLAVDLAIIRGGEAIWSLDTFREFDGFMQKAFREVIGSLEGESMRLFWGGHWVTLRDGPHWELQGCDSVRP